MGRFIHTNKLHWCIALFILANSALVLAPNEILAARAVNNSSYANEHQRGFVAGQMFALSEIPAIDVKIGGKLFRVPCRYRPFVVNMEDMEIPCRRNTGSKVSGRSITISTSFNKVRNADVGAQIDWVSNIYPAQVRIELSRFANSDDAEQYLSMFRSTSPPTDMRILPEENGFYIHRTGNGRERYYIAKPDLANTLKGYPLTIHCSSGDFCLSKYIWSPKVWVSFRFKAKNRPMETWVDLHRSVHRFIDQLHKDELR